MVSKHLPALLSAVTLASAGVLQRAGSCTSDDCARAVTGTRLADCSSFLAYTAYPITTKTVTVTPKPTTIYSTVATETVTDFVTATTTFFQATTDVESYNSPPTATSNHKREVAGYDAHGVGSAAIIAPTDVPSYAGACSGAASYSSACSCQGATGRTTVADSSTSTHTVTVTATPATDTVYRTATATVTAYDYVGVDAPLYTDNIPCDQTIENGQVKIICEATIAGGQIDQSVAAKDFDDCLNSFNLFYEHTDTNSFIYNIETKDCGVSGQVGPQYENAKNVVYGYLIQ